MRFCVRVCDLNLAATAGCVCVCVCVSYCMPSRVWLKKKNPFYASLGDFQILFECCDNVCYSTLLLCASTYLITTRGDGQHS